MATGRSQEARRLLSEVFERGGNPTLLPVLSDLLGRTFEREGRDDDAERCWKQATEWDPQLSGPWLNQR